MIPIKVKLQPHQLKVVEHIKNPDVRGVIVWHGLGSGKTITSIASAEQFPKQQVFVITPASLRTNFEKEITKVGANKKRYTITSYESFRKTVTKPSKSKFKYKTKEELKELTIDELKSICKKFKIECFNASKKDLVEFINTFRIHLDAIEDETESLQGKILIIDEAHRLRNQSGTIVSFILKKARDAFKIILLTGTPIVNHPSDFSPLINLIKNDNVFPVTKKSFDDMFVTTKKVAVKKKVFFGLFEKTVLESAKELKNMNLFKKGIDRLFSHHVETNHQFFPKVIRHIKEVEMTDLQQKLHKRAERETLTENDVKLMKGGFFDESNNSNFASRVNAFINKTRQITNIVENKSPKMDEILDEILSKKTFPVVVYSNFKTAGILPMKELLDKHKISNQLFTGELSDGQKKDIIQRYNKRKFNVLLITSSGAEGIDLKNTRQIHIMEPHFNESKIDQVIGRGIRFKSHESLPVKDRKVDVYYWSSVFSSERNLSADKYLIELSQKKKTISNMFLNTIKNNSIEKRKPLEKSHRVEIKKRSRVDGRNSKLI